MFTWRSSHVWFVDKNECETDNGGCTHTCTNYVGGFNCSCNDGFQLMNDKKGCQRKSSAFNLSRSMVHYLRNTVWQLFLSWLTISGCRIVLNVSPLRCPSSASSISITSISISLIRESFYPICYIPLHLLPGSDASVILHTLCCHP